MVEFGRNELSKYVEEPMSYKQSFCRRMLIVQSTYIRLTLIYLFTFFTKPSQRMKHELCKAVHKANLQSVAFTIDIKLDRSGLYSTFYFHINGAIAPLPKNRVLFRLFVKTTRQIFTRLNLNAPFVSFWYSQVALSTIASFFTKLRFLEFDCFFILIF